MAQRTSSDQSSAFTSLLGGPREEVVRQLKRHGVRTAPQLAAALGVTDVAVRRHLGVLEDENLVEFETVRQARGRPASVYRLTDRGNRLFGDRYSEMTRELIGFIGDEHGREGVRRYLRWRLERETSALTDAVTADEFPDRVEQLADALSAAGYQAEVSVAGDGIQLTQHHCAIFDVAKHHPEMCAYEAASFKQVLGEDVQLSRRETLANGATACVCTVTPKHTASESSS